MWKCILLSLLASVSVCLVFSLADKQERQIGVVDAVKLFNGYNMKVELEGIEKRKLLIISKQLDSINNFIQTARAVRNAVAEKQLTYTARIIKDQLDKEYETSNKLINDQVWKRLNAAIEQFGKEKKVHLIIGANGMGTVLYNDAYYDMTNDAIKFVNKKYEEGN